jgi:hypothetical protein
MKRYLFCDSASSARFVNSRMFLWVLIAGFSQPLSAQADRLSDLEKRVEELQLQVSEQSVSNSNSQGAMKSFLNDNLTFGGFFEPSILTVFGPDTDTQMSAISNLLGLNIAADFSERLRFSSQILTALAISLANQHNDPNAGALSLSTRRSFTTVSFATLVTQAYLEFRNSDGFHIQGGVGYVPFGHAFQLREPVLFARRGGPLTLRTTDLVGPLWTGVHVLGHFPTSGGHWGYNAYTFTQVLGERFPGLGTRLWWASNDDHIHGGISSQVGKRGIDTFKNLGADLRLKFGPWTFTTEYIRAVVNGDDPWATYLEPSLAILEESVLLYVFGDYSNSSRNITGTTARGQPDPIQKWEYGAGVNWLPTTFTRLRLGLTRHDYVGATSTPSGVNRDYMSVDASAGVAF